MRVLRWQVPVDDEWHDVGPGRVVLVATRHDPAKVEVWTEEHVEPFDVETTRQVRVFGTGQPIEETVRHIGSALAADGRLVWHVYERRAEAGRG